MRNKYALHLPFITHSKLGNLTCLKAARATRFGVCAVVGDMDVLGEPREVLDGPPEGGPVPDLSHEPQVFAPGVNEEDVNEIAKKLGIA